MIVPALNEENAIARVVKEALEEGVGEVVVVDNGSTDQTAHIALASGATVLSESKRGYGAACLKGIAYLRGQVEPPHIVVFMDGDYADYAEDIPALIAPILKQDVDMVIGSRVLGKPEQGSLTLPQRIGNWIATRLMFVLFGVQYTDLGPFRAISLNALLGLNMVDQNYGWTAEMQVKASKSGLRIREVPVSYRQRIGQSKVSGTVKGSIFAGFAILRTIFKYA